MNHGVVSRCAQCVKDRLINAMSSIYFALSLAANVALLRKWTTCMMHFALFFMRVISASIDFVSPCILPLSITLTDDSPQMLGFSVLAFA